jgi:hypothetical protein
MIDGASARGRRDFAGRPAFAGSPAFTGRLCTGSLKSAAFAGSPGPPFRKQPAAMEINPITNSIRDLEERSTSLRGYL